MAARGRRWLTLVAVIATAVALATGGTLLLRREPDPTPASTPHPRPPTTVTDSAPRPARPLTYAEGRTIHLGDRTVDAGHDLLSLDVVDGGVAFTTFDGGVWFTDGSTTAQIGATSPGQASHRGILWGPAGRPNHWVVSDNTGSRLAWFEYPAHDRPEIVVYDAHEAKRVSRVPIEPKRGCGRCAQIISVDDDHVYWTDTLWRDLGSSDQSESRTRPFRYEVSTGTQIRISAADYEADLRTRTRMLVVGDALDSGTLSDGIDQGFALVGRRLVARAPGGVSAFDPVSGKRLALEAPSGYGYGYGYAERLHLFQWLDDDRFALLDASSWNTGDYLGEDLVVCSISSDSCEVAVRRPPTAGSPIVPELGTPGAEQALARAMNH